MSFLQPQTFLVFLYNQLKSPAESLLNHFLMSLYFNVLIIVNIYQEPVIMAGPQLGVLKQKSEYKRAHVYRTKCQPRSQHSLSSPKSDPVVPIS